MRSQTAVESLHNLQVAAEELKSFLAEPASLMSALGTLQSHSIHQTPYGAEQLQERGGPAPAWTNPFGSNQHQGNFVYRGAAYTPGMALSLGMIERGMARAPAPSFGWLSRTLDSPYSESTFHSPNPQTCERLSSSLNLGRVNSMIQPIPVHIFENQVDGDMVLVAELPGINKKDIEVRTDKNIVRITAKRAFDLSGNLLMEASEAHGSSSQTTLLAQTIALPFAIDAAKTVAKYENGVLKIHAARSEKERESKIKLM